MRRSDYQRQRERPRRSFLSKVVNGILMILSVVSSIALLLTLLVPIVNPSVSWIFPVLGLVAPVTYVVNLLLALYWIITWRLFFAIPMVALLLFGVSSISLFINMEVAVEHNIERYNSMPKVMSFNVRGLINDDGQWSTEEMGEYLVGQNADIICLQELHPRDKGYKPKVEQRLKDYTKAKVKSLAIYSKYPIIKHEDIFSKDSNEMWRAMWVDLIIKKDTIRVFNNHLHSTTINAADDEYLTSKKIVLDTLRKDKIKDIISRFSQGSVERTKQIDTIAKVIASSPYPVVVCGDFNDTPISHTYNVMSHELTDAFQASGKGYSYTFRGFYNTLRIDYILVSETITPHNYIVDEECTLSDHLPIMTHIEINKHK